MITGSVTDASGFAVPKIGAIVLPLFSGFGVEAIVTRLNDAGAKADGMRADDLDRRTPSPEK